MPILLYEPEPGIAQVLRDSQAAPAEAVSLRPGELWQQIPFETWTSYIGDRVKIADVLDRYHSNLGHEPKRGEFCIDCGSVLEIGRVTLESPFWRFLFVGISWVDLFLYPSKGKRRSILQQGSEHPVRYCPTCSGIWITH